MESWWFIVLTDVPALRASQDCSKMAGNARASVTYDALDSKRGPLKVHAIVIEEGQLRGGQNVQALEMA